MHGAGRRHHSAFRPYRSGDRVTYTDTTKES